jgi:hypothetical protein
MLAKFNTPAYFGATSVREKCIKALVPGVNVIKLFMDLIYECSYQARVFVHGMPF